MDTGLLFFIGGGATREKGRVYVHFHWNDQFNYGGNLTMMVNSTTIIMKSDRDFRIMICEQSSVLKIARKQIIV